MLWLMFGRGEGGWSRFSSDLSGLIDLGLPDMDGHELVKKLRGYQGSDASTFICVSAHRLECQHLNQHTIDQFIQKPCAIQDLQDAMALSA